MMKKVIVLILAATIVSGRLFPSKLCTLPEVSKPRMILVDGNHIYIVDRHSFAVLVYNIENYRFLKRLGKKGEGPGEFSTPPIINLTQDRLIVNDLHKIIAYSRGLEFLEETRPGLFLSTFTPVADHFILKDSLAAEQGKTRHLFFFDHRYLKIKEVPNGTAPRVDDYLITPYPHARNWKGKLYAASPVENFLIKVFDKWGKELYSIEKKLTKIEAEQKHKERYLELFMSVLGPRLFSKHKGRGRFKRPLPEYLPDIKNFWVNDDTIYVKTYDIKGDTDRYLVMDLRGENMREIFLPKALFKRFTFGNGKFYHLVDNEDTETWELHSHPLAP